MVAAWLQAAALFAFGLMVLAWGSLPVFAVIGATLFVRYVMGVCGT